MWCDPTVAAAHLRVLPAEGAVYSIRSLGGGYHPVVDVDRSRLPPNGAVRPDGTNEGR